jgi:hypothetical protein
MLSPSPVPMLQGKKPRGLKLAWYLALMRHGKKPYRHTTREGESGNASALAPSIFCASRRRRDGLPAEAPQCDGSRITGTTYGKLGGDFLVEAGKRDGLTPDRAFGLPVPPGQQSVN